MGTSVVLSPAIVIAICGAVACYKDAKRIWVWIWGAMFGVAVAGSAIAMPFVMGGEVTTRFAGRGAEVVNEEVNGGSGKKPPIAEKDAEVPAAPER